jgi:hypothetical protein
MNSHGSHSTPISTRRQKNHYRPIVSITRNIRQSTPTLLHHNLNSQMTTLSTNKLVTFPHHVQISTATSQKALPESKREHYPCNTIYPRIGPHPATSILHNSIPPLPSLPFPSIPPPLPDHSTIPACDERRHPVSMST